jgi:hypothetical protein
MVQENDGKYMIANEEFRMIEDGTFVTLTHPHWSLNGIGKNISEAVMDLYKEAEIISEMYLDEPTEKLSQHSQKLKEFLVHLSKRRK